MISEYERDLLLSNRTYAEMFCLVSMMQDIFCIPVVKEILLSEYYYSEKNQQLSEIIYDLYSKDITPDLEAVTVELDRKQDSQGIINYLFEIYESVPISNKFDNRQNAEYYAKQVRTAWIERQARILLGQSYQQLNGLIDDPNIIISNLIEKLRELNVPAKNCSIADELDNIKELLVSEGIKGIPTGFRSIDNLTCGFQQGELYIIGGRPRMGKTALALKIMINLARADVPTLFVSLEMSIQQLLLRILSIVSALPYRIFKANYQKSDDTMQRISKAMEDIKTMRFSIDDCPGVSIDRICSSIESAYQKDNIQVAFVDHLHLVNVSNMGYNNVEAYSNISLALKNIARRLNISVVCLSQLNRGLEYRADKRPILPDLRESGGIEQNADNVWFVHNPAVFDDTLKKPIQDVELIIAKNKSLETGIVPLKFKGAYMEFTED